jgi:DNA-binding response OmpR family regulator
MDVRLTNPEFRLLHLLMSRPGFVFSLEEIIESIWGGYGNGDQVLLKNVVYRLRRKIEEDPSHPLFLQTGKEAILFRAKEGGFRIIAVVSHVTYCDQL